MDAQRREDLLGAAVYMRTISNPKPVVIPLHTKRR
jgi:hypothetical protein